MGGSLPTEREVAVFASNSGETLAITVDEDVEAKSLIIVGEGATVIDIGADSPTWLVLGDGGLLEEDGVAACQASDCAVKNLTMAKGFSQHPIGSGIQYDADSDEIVGTGLYNAFNITCAQGYASVGNATSEIVTCPFDASYDADSFELLACAEIFYESDWCSAGIWGIEDDGDWNDPDAWVYETAPTSLDLAVLSNPGHVTDTLTVSISEDVSAGSLTIEQGDGSIVLEIGGDDAAMLVLAASDDGPLCSDAMCEDAQLIDGLPRSEEHTSELQSHV